MKRKILIKVGTFVFTLFLVFMISATVDARDNFIAQIFYQDSTASYLANDLVVGEAYYSMKYTPEYHDEYNSSRKGIYVEENEHEKLKLRMHVRDMIFGIKEYEMVQDLGYQLVKYVFDRDANGNIINSVAHIEPNTNWYDYSKDIMYF